MKDSLRVARRALAAAPQLTVAIGVLALLNTATWAVGAVLLSRAIGDVAAGRPAYTLTVPLLALAAALLGGAITAAMFGPLNVRLRRAVVQHQVDDVMRRLAVFEATPADHARARELGPLGDRVVGVPHREALGAVSDLLVTRCRGLAGVVIVATVSPLAALVMAVSIAAYGGAFTRFLDDVLAGLASDGPVAAQRAKYVRSLHFQHGVAGELRTFGALPWLLRTFTRLSAAGRIEAMRQRQRHVRAVVGYSLLATAAVFGSFAWLISRAWSGHLGIETLALAVQGALLILDLGPAGDVAVLFRQTAQVERDLATGDDVAQPPTAEIGALLDAAVVCRAVRLTYPGAEQPAIDIDELTIMHGERVAVVGRNGAGKSTLFGVIAGYLEPTVGSVIVDRSGVSIALQRAARYPATLRDNIVLGSARVDVDRALATVGGVPEDRLDEFVGDPGIEAADLSGGQWQRVGLARAFGHAGAGVLLLDEPSAALDPAAEAEFFRRALAEAHARLDGCTVLLSTHHLPNVRFVDRIVVLDAGKVVEDGSHQALMDQGGRYAAMFTAQARSYGVDL